MRRIGRGIAATSGVQVEVLLTTAEDFTTELFLNSAAEAHLSEPLPTSPTHQTTLRQWARREKFQQEEALYEKAGLQYLVPELREGLGEIVLAAEKKLPEPIAGSAKRIPPAGWPRTDST